MNLRVIIIVLALLSLFSTSIGGYLYYSSLKNAELEESFFIADEQLKDIANHVDFYLAEHQRSVQALGGLKEIQNALVDQDGDSLAAANVILDHFQKSLEVSVCYLMDSRGRTIASSNRSAPDSFLGKNYSFRPYFQQSMNGITSVYMALGITSKKRGAYFGYPVYGHSSDIPAGVLVIKAFIDDIESEINNPYEGVMLLTDPRGVVFISNRPEWMYHVLWRLSDEDLREIQESRQFSTGPWKWTGIEKKGETHAIDASGREYHIHKRGLRNYPGWNILYLHDHHEALKTITVPLFKTAGYIILSLCVLIAISVMLLYKKASNNIIMRMRAEEELRKHLLMEKQFNQELEPLVAERTMNVIALSVADKLRNPATVIGLICRKIVNKLHDPDKIKEGIDNIMRETQKLEDIVQDYGSLLKSRKSMFVHDDINNVVREAAALVQAEAKGKGIRLLAKLSHEALKINLRKNLLRIALFHILSNAVHSTPRGGSITAETSRVEDRVFLVISDTGTGFKKEILERVFDPFFSTKQDSYGLGLPLVRHIVAEHRGEIEVRSEEGKGSSFILTFPESWIR
jgi:C4-dicarboxylate-specific signal transduction histidine kinase